MESLWKETAMAAPGKKKLSAAGDAWPVGSSGEGERRTVLNGSHGERGVGCGSGTETKRMGKSITLKQKKGEGWGERGPESEEESLKRHARKKIEEIISAAPS